VIDLIYGQDQAVANWVQARLPEIRNGFGQYSAIGIIEDGRSIAGVVYHDYRRFSIQMSMASESPHWCSRRTLRALLGYPFLQLMVARITVCTAKHNKKLRSLVERLGFELEGKLRAGFDGQRDLLIYGLLRKDADRWITNAVRREEIEVERFATSTAAA
jgi:RimJ/RimL family protein N-acetyltransferase